MGVDFVLEGEFIDESERNAVFDRIPRDWLVLGDEAVSVGVGEVDLSPPCRCLEVVICCL